VLLDERVGSLRSIGNAQLPIEHYHKCLNAPLFANAIMDRLVRRSHKIHLQGKESMRKQRARTAKETAKG
jgi:hypothetical protein